MDAGGHFGGGFDAGMHHHAGADATHHHHAAAHAAHMHHHHSTHAGHHHLHHTSAFTDTDMATPLTTSPMMFGGVPHRYGAGGRPMYLLPAPPASCPGRVIVRVAVDPQGLDLGSWAPQLDGNSGFLLSQNGSWLRQATLDSLMGELQSLAARSPMAEGRLRKRSMMVMLGMFLAGVTWVSAPMWTGLAFSMSPDNSNFELIAGIMIGGFVAIVGLMMLSMKAMTDGARRAYSEVDHQRKSFCTAWAALNPGHELTYHQGQTSVSYFELSPSTTSSQAQAMYASNAY